MEIEKRVYKMEAILPEVEIRAAEVVENVFTTEDGQERKSSYIDLKCDDKNLNRIYLKDKNIDNIDKYHRGDIGDFYILIDAEEEFKKKYTITVRDFKKKK